MIVDAAWLERHGISRQLRRKYVMHQWLLALGRGVYRRLALSENAEPIPWQQLVISLNALLQVPASRACSCGRFRMPMQAFSSISGRRLPAPAPAPPPG
jgi:hypothetical protein